MEVDRPRFALVLQDQETGNHADAYRRLRSLLKRLLRSYKFKCVAMQPDMKDVKPTESET